MLKNIFQNRLTAYDKFLLIWFGVIFIFFSLAKAKANYYIITAMPPLFLLLANYLNSKIVFSKFLTFFLCLPALLMNLAIIFIIFFVNNEIIIAISSHMHKIHIGLIVVNCCMLLTICCKSRITTQLLTFIISAQSIVLVIIALDVMPKIEHLYSTKPTVVKLNLATQQEFYIYKNFETFSTVAFYIKKAVKIIDSNSNDLLYGQKHINSPIFISMNDLLRQTTPYKTYIMIEPQLLANFPYPYKLINKSYKTAVIQLTR